MLLEGKHALPSPLNDMANIPPSDESRGSRHRFAWLGSDRRAIIFGMILAEMCSLKGGLVLHSRMGRVMICALTFFLRVGSGNRV